MLAADGDGDPLAAAARIPATAWRAAHDALPGGAVLVHVPRAGYLPAVACATCRRPARCPACSGPLQLPRSSGQGPGCAWCARVWPAWTCPHCEGRGLLIDPDPAGRVQKLLAGEVDLVQELAPAAIETLKINPAVEVTARESFAVAYL